MENMKRKETILMEKQRYNNIKATGKWLELNILVGGESVEDEDGHSCVIPVVGMEGHHCGSKEIACLYLTVKQMLEELQHDYPGECLAAEMSAKVEKGRFN